MKDLQRALSQVIYTNNSFWRNPVSAFFTLVFPIMFLVIFSLIFGNQDITIAGVKTKVATFYVPAITGFSVITACYTNIAISLSFQRDRGVLKRLRATPLPSWALMCETPRRAFAPTAPRPSRPSESTVCGPRATGSR